MINKITVVLFMLFFMFFSFNSKAQSGINTRFVLVEVTNFSKEKILPMLIQKSGKIPGMDIVGYCNDQSLVAIRLNSSQYRDDKVIVDFFKELGLVIYIKENIGEFQMNAICHQTYKEIN